MFLKKGNTLHIAIALFLLGIIGLFIYHQNSSEESFIRKNVKFLKSVSEQLQNLQKDEKLQSEQLEQNILQKIDELQEKQKSEVKTNEIIQKIDSASAKLNLKNKNNSKEILETFDDSKFQFSMSEILNGLEQDDPRILKEIRKNYLKPPSPRNLSYNFTDKNLNTRGSDPSKKGTSKRVLEILGGNITNGTFVESGANNGEDSNTLLLERDYNWSGVLIEPQPVSLKKLYTKNRKSWISNVCSSPLTKPMKMKFNQIVNYDVASHLLINRDEKYLNKREDFITVQCFPIYSVLAALNYTIVDYFSLDVESVEFDVLKTIPFDKIIFKVITVEVQFIHDVTTAMVKYMATKGYIFAGKVYLDYIFAHNSTDFAKKFSENEEKLKKISIGKETTTQKPK